MSSVAISGNASGAGVLTIAAPNTANNYTLTLPAATGIVLSSAGALVTTPTNGLGYAAGAGGNVTQATSKTTSVTLNTPSGQITMNNAALAANTSATFSVSNTIVTTADTVLVSSPFSNADSYRIECSKCGAGFFNIRATNITGGSLSEAVVLNFNVIKGASS